MHDLLGPQAEAYRQGMAAVGAQLGAERGATAAATVTAGGVLPAPDRSQLTVEEGEEEMATAAEMAAREVEGLSPEDRRRLLGIRAEMDARDAERDWKPAGDAEPPSVSPTFGGSDLEADIAQMEAELLPPSGDGDIRPDDLVVPDRVPNLVEAVLEAHNYIDNYQSQRRVVLRAGEHIWLSYNLGRIEVLRQLCLIAQAGAVLKGRWILLDGSSGEFRHCRNLWQTETKGGIRVINEPTMYVRGARPWHFVNCDIRCGGSLCLLVSRNGDATLHHCTLGGAAPRTYVMDTDRKFVATEAITVLGKAWVVARFCEIVDTYGPACNVAGQSHLLLESCYFLRAAIGVVFDRQSVSVVKGCTFYDTFDAAFWTSPSEDTRLCVELVANAVHGCVWVSNKRPENLRLKHNNFDPTFPSQWNEIVQTHPPLVHQRTALGLTWTQRPPPEGNRQATDFPF